jgi:hypothetical protein
MLVPLLFGVSAVLMGIKGVKDFISGTDNLSEAKKIIENANKRYQSEYDNTAIIVEDFINKDLAEIGKKKLEAMEVRERLIEILVRFIKKYRISNLPLPENVNVKDIIKEAEIESVQLVEGIKVLKGVVKSVGASGLAYVGAQGTAVAIGTASTGTAISALSGAAAKNAILAWFGGGSLAAGGGGMALGSVVLGGFVVAPAIMFGGMVLNKYSEEKLSEARSYEAKIEAEIRKLKIIRDNISYAKEYLKIYSETLDKLTKITKKMIRWSIFVMKKYAVKYHLKRFLNRIIPFYKVDATSLTDKERAFLETIFVMNKALKSMLEIDIIDNTGLYAINKGVENIVNETNRLIDKVLKEGVV